MSELNYTTNSDSQSQYACSLVHCHCGACGHAIAEDGHCGCEDNRTHPVASIDRDLRSRYLLACQYAMKRLRELGEPVDVIEAICDGNQIAAAIALEHEVVSSEVHSIDAEERMK